MREDFDAQWHALAEDVLILQRKVTESCKLLQLSLSM